MSDTAKLATLSEAEINIMSKLSSNGITTSDSALSMRQMEKIHLNRITIQKYCDRLADYGFLIKKERAAGLQLWKYYHLTELGSYFVSKSIIDKSIREETPVKEVKDEMDRMLKILPLIKPIGNKFVFYDTLRRVIHGTDLELSYLNQARFLGITMQILDSSNSTVATYKRLAITEIFTMNEYFLKDIVQHLKNVLTFTFYYDLHKNLDIQIKLGETDLKYAKNAEKIKMQIKENKKTLKELNKFIQNSPELQKINLIIGGNYKINLLNFRNEKNV